jgi:uroporphyrinogen decarboxylase
MKKDIGDRVCLAGNIDLDLLAIGTPDQVKAVVHRLAATCGEGGGYMLSSSNSIPEWAKLENFLAMGEALQEFNRFKF